MRRVNEMTKRERVLNHVFCGKVLAAADGQASLLVHRQNGDVEERYFCAFWDELVPMKDFLDIKPFLVGSHTGYECLGLTPEEFRKS